MARGAMGQGPMPPLEPRQELPAAAALDVTGEGGLRGSAGGRGGWAGAALWRVCECDEKHTYDFAKALLLEEKGIITKSKYKIAKVLGKTMAEQGLALVYGGGKVGLMQGLNWWLYEADVVAHARRRGGAHLEAAGVAVLDPNATTLEAADLRASQGGGAGLGRCAEINQAAVDWARAQLSEAAGAKRARRALAARAQRSAIDLVLDLAVAAVRSFVRSSAHGLRDLNSPPLPCPGLFPTHKGTTASQPPPPCFPGALSPREAPQRLQT